MTEPMTLGSYLRAARRKRRVSIERAADETRIRKDFLMRMESDEFDFLAPAYVRGFLRSYARFLRVPIEPLLDEFDRIIGLPRIDASQIAAMEHKAKRNTPRARPLKNNWALAAVLAAAALLGLGVIGLLTDPKGARPARDVAEQRTPTGVPSSDATVVPAAGPSATPVTGGDVLAFSDGIEVTIEATTDECWVDVTTDGDNVYTSVMDLGEHAGPFSAEDEMTIILGNAGGVELVINGRRFGPIGGLGEVVTLHLPEDAEELL